MSSIMVIASDALLAEITPPAEFNTIIIDYEHRRIDDGGNDDNFGIFPTDRVNVLELPSDKQYFALLQWNYYTPGRAKKVIAYLKDQLVMTDEVELWHVWQDMDFDHKVRKTEIPISDLVIEDIEELDRLEVYREPITDHCYVIYNDADS